MALIRDRVGFAGLNGVHGELPTVIAGSVDEGGRGASGDHPISGEGVCVWSLASVLHEAMLKREQRRADAGRDADLVVDVLDVMVDSLRRYEQGLRHLTVGEPTDHKTEHFYLTLGQSSGPHAVAPRRE